VTPPRRCCLAASGRPVGIPRRRLTNRRSRRPGERFVLQLRVLFSLGTLAVYGGCSGDVVAIRVEAVPHCLPLALGDSAYLLASAERSSFPVRAYSSASTPEAFAWNSSDPNVVSVTRHGLIYARSIGLATISASAEGLTGKAEVQIAKVGQTATVDPLAVSLRVGDTVVLNAHAWDSAGVPIVLRGSQVLFASGDDASIVDVSNDLPDKGRAVGVSHGSANITWLVGSRCGVVPVTVR